LLSSLRSRKIEGKPSLNDKAKHSNSRNGLLFAIKSRKIEDDAYLKIDKDNLSSTPKSELGIQERYFDTNRTNLPKGNALLSAIRSRGKVADRVSQENEASHENATSSIVNLLSDVEESFTDKISDFGSSNSPTTPMHELDKCQFRGLDMKANLRELCNDPEESDFTIKKISEETLGIFTNNKILKGDYIMPEALASSFMIFTSTQSTDTNYGSIATFNGTSSISPSWIPTLSPKASQKPVMKPRSILKPSELAPLSPKLALIDEPSNKPSFAIESNISIEEREFHVSTLHHFAIESNISIEEREFHVSTLHHFAIESNIFKERRFQFRPPSLPPTEEAHLLQTYSSCPKRGSSMFRPPSLPPTEEAHLLQTYSSCPKRGSSMFGPPLLPPTEEREFQGSHPPPSHPSDLSLGIIFPTTNRFQWIDTKLAKSNKSMPSTNSPLFFYKANIPTISFFFFFFAIASFSLVNSQSEGVSRIVRTALFLSFRCSTDHTTQEISNSF
jgi:hypothetical protein